MALLLGFVLAATCLASGALAEDDISSFRVNLTEPMIDCFKQRKVYWGTGNKQCYELPNSAECPANQWLVLDSEKLDSDDRMEPTCKNRPCASTLDVYWPAGGTCIRMTTKNLCPEGNELANDLYGDGVCSCKKSPIHLPLNLSIEATKCYELYKQGPCPVGQVLVAQHVEKKSHIAVCQRDPCAEYKKKKKRNSTYALHLEDNHCYALNSAGPCTNNTVFRVSAPSYLPGCSAAYQLSITQFVAKCVSSGPEERCSTAVQIEKENIDSFTYNAAMTNMRKHAS